MIKLSKWDWTYLVVSIGSMLALLGYLALQFGCGYDLDVKVGVSLDDKCLLELPDCDERSGSYSCGHYEGTSWVIEPGCHVACAAGRYIVCSTMGPQCVQDVGDEETNVPVVCAGDGE